MTDKLERVQKAFLTFAKRAEKVSIDILQDTFVDTAPLTTILATPNNQILYGRRGTGKTHALLYLASQVKEAGDHAMYVDLRSIGSDGSIYNDHSLSVAERSVRLVLDVLNAVQAELWEMAVNVISTHSNTTELTRRLEDFDAAINEVSLDGVVTVSDHSETKTQGGVSGDVKVAPTIAEMSLSAGMQRKQAQGTQRTRTGTERVKLNFGRVQGTLNSLIGILGGPRI